MFTIDRGAYLYGLWLYTIRGTGYAYESRMIHTVHILENEHFIRMSHLGILSYVSPPAISRDNTHLGNVHRMCQTAMKFDVHTVIFRSSEFDGIIRLQHIVVTRLKIEQFVARNMKICCFLEHLCINFSRMLLSTSF